MSRELIDQVIEQQQYPVLNKDSYDEYINSQEFSMIFFAGDPKRYPETNDVVIVLPELEKAFVDQFSIAVIEEGSERLLAKKYGFTVWPTLVFLKKGKFLGMISRIQDWSDYMNEIPVILSKKPTYAPSVGISVEVK